jgi:hypothetical protein
MDEVVESAPTTYGLAPMRMLVGNVNMSVEHGECLEQSQGQKKNLIGFIVGQAFQPHLENKGLHPMGV